MTLLIWLLMEDTAATIDKSTLLQDFTLSQTFWNTLYFIFMKIFHYLAIISLVFLWQWALGHFTSENARKAGWNSRKKNTLGFGSWIWLLFAMWPWTNYLTIQDFKKLFKNFFSKVMEGKFEENNERRCDKKLRIRGNRRHFYLPYLSGPA